MTTVSRSVPIPQPLLSFATPRWIALALFLITLVLRVPFTSQTLNHWDSVNHALALTDFDVRAHRPQPPGYILYIGIARLVNLLVPDPQTALVIVSMVASALAVAFLFLLVTQMASREIGLTAALLLMTSPAFWFDGEVALPYVVEGCVTIAVALLCYKLVLGERKYVLLTAVVLAIAGGLRQQLFLFLAPLAVYAYWRYGWRVWLKAGALFTAVSLLSLVPLFLNVGGVREYFALLANFSLLSSTQTSVFSSGLSAFLRNGTRLGLFTLYALNFASIPLLLGLIQVVRTRALRSLWDDARTRFLAVWIAPALLFYLFYHMGSPGLIYVYLPALYAIAALALHSLLSNHVQWRALSVIALCAANAFFFLALPADLYIGTNARVLNFQAMQQHDRSLLHRVNTIRENFDPESTMVFSNDWRFAEYYLPAYRIVVAPTGAGNRLVLIQNHREQYLNMDRLNPSNVSTIVWFDEQLPPIFKDAFKDCLITSHQLCMPVRELARPGALQIQRDKILVTAE
jgi:hypothetical protein